jgi:formate transporter
LGLAISKWAPVSFWADLSHGANAAPPAIPVGGFLANLAAVTAGNWIGGALLVGGVYWFLYRKPAGPTH